MLHLSKLCVGIGSVGQLRDWQERRTESHPPLRHKTRHAPRRVEEIVGGGSIYWVIAGVMLVRQRIVAIRPDTWDDRTACAALLLHPDLVAVEARATRAFQGWRYLAAADAPADLDRSDRSAEHGLPDGLRADLRRLALL